MTVKAGFMVPHPPMIVPEIGRGSEAQIRETTDAYERVADEIAAIDPDTILITSPHSIMYADYIHISPGDGATGSFGQFGAPEVSFDVRYDSELVSSICRIAEDKNFPAGTMGEREKALDHGTMVPLWFIERAYEKTGKEKRYEIVRTGLSGLSLADHYRFGQIIAEAAGGTEAIGGPSKEIGDPPESTGGKSIVIVASGDLSHKLQEEGPYGFAKEGPEYDERIMDVCGRGAFGELFDFSESLCESAAECGHRSFVIMAGAFDGVDVDAKAISHQDITGVGYGVCSFYPGETNEDRRFLDMYLRRTEEELAAKKANEDPYVKLARKSVESYVLGREHIDIPEDLPEEMTKSKAGAFVSIHKQGALRGCIGTTGPTTDCIAQEIIDNAISASTRDPRFPPIGPEELGYLEISVDVLGEPEDISSEDELDVKRYGVIVSSTGKRGLLLPDLEGIDTVQQQIDIAKQKAGIHRFESIRLQRFEVTRHE